MSILTRREFIRNAALLGAGGIAGALTVTSIQQIRGPARQNSQPIVDGDGKAVRPEQFAPGQVVLTAAWNEAPATIYRLRTAALQAATRLRGRNTMRFAIPDPTSSDYHYVAFDARCKHLGCTVGWDASLGASRDVSDYDGDGEPDGRVLCPCHHAQYDVHDLGTQTEGTPAPEPLDVLDLQLQDGQFWARRRIEQRNPGDAATA